MLCIATLTCCMKEVVFERALGLMSAAYLRTHRNSLPYGIGRLLCLCPCPCPAERFLMACNNVALRLSPWWQSMALYCTAQKITPECFKTPAKSHRAFHLHLDSPSLIRCFACTLLGLCDVMPSSSELSDPSKGRACLGRCLPPYTLRS